MQKCIAFLVSLCMETHHIQIQKTAHYYTIGGIGKHIKNLILVCHGYGQLASRFIYKFDDLEDGETFILAPEGLSRFYWKGFTGEVGASWMTKADRLDEIEDYSRYIKLLYDKYVSECADDVKITLLGFSQGCATQCRWIMRYRPDFDNLILWAGSFPKDINYLAAKSYFSNKKLFTIIGKNDEFLTAKNLDNQKKFIASQELDNELIFFEGKHEIDRETLKQLIEKL